MSKMEETGLVDEFQNCSSLETPTEDIVLEKIEACSSEVLAGQNVVGQGEQQILGYCDVMGTSDFLERTHIVSVDESQNYSSLETPENIVIEKIEECSHEALANLKREHLVLGHYTLGTSGSNAPIYMKYLRTHSRYQKLRFVRVDGNKFYIMLKKPNSQLETTLEGGAELPAGNASMNVDMKDTGSPYKENDLSLNQSVSVMSLEDQKAASNQMEECSSYEDSEKVN